MSRRGKEFFPPSTCQELFQTQPKQHKFSIYVRNVRTGGVSIVMGPRSYLLGVDEILFEKELSPTVENLLL